MQKRVIGLSLIILSGLLALSNITITGAVIGISKTSFSFISLVIFLVGFVLVLAERGEESKLAEMAGEAHNAANYDKYKQRLRFTESHGVPPEDEGAWVTRYHAFVRKWKPDFSHGLNKKKAPAGFYLASSKKEALEILQGMGHHLKDLDIAEVKISRNVYRAENTRDLIQGAGSDYSTEEGYEKIPASKYRKANRLIDRGLIKIQELH